MVAAAGGVERRRVHHSPHRCPSALSSGRSESALAACLAWGAAGALPTEEIVSACFGAACFSADSVGGERLVVVAIGGIGGRGMGGISTTGTAALTQQLLPTARDSKGAKLRTETMQNETILHSRRK